MGFIYVILCLVSGKMYVGQTTSNVQQRWEEHKSKARQMIYHQLTDPERLRKQGILQSHLYRAMASHGIEEFIIETIDECNDDILNAEETYWINAFKTRSPNGYNLMSGGGAGGQHAETTIEQISLTKQANVDNYRNPILQGLPPYTAYRNNPEQGGEMIRVNGHPLCPGKNFLVKEYGSFEATKEAVVTFVKELEQSQQTYSRPKLGGDEFANMPGFCVTKLGYRVNVVRGGVNFDRKFQSKNKTDEENKQDALACYKHVMYQIAL